MYMSVYMYIIMYLGTHYIIIYNIRIHINNDVSNNKNAHMYMYQI